MEQQETWWVEFNGVKYTDKDSKLSVYQRVFLLSEARGVRTTMTSVWEMFDNMDIKGVYEFIKGWEEYITEYFKYVDLVEGEPRSPNTTDDEYVSNRVRNTDQGLILDIMKSYWFRFTGEQYR